MQSAKTTADISLSKIIYSFFKALKFLSATTQYYSEIVYNLYQAIGANSIENSRLLLVMIRQTFGKECEILL